MWPHHQPQHHYSLTEAAEDTKRATPRQSGQLVNVCTASFSVQAGAPPYSSSLTWGETFGFGSTCGSIRSIRLRSSFPYKEALASRAEFLSRLRAPRGRMRSAPRTTLRAKRRTVLRATMWSERTLNAPCAESSPVGLAPICEWITITQHAFCFRCR